MMMMPLVKKWTRNLCHLVQIVLYFHVRTRHGIIRKYIMWQKTVTDFNSVMNNIDFCFVFITNHWIIQTIVISTWLFNIWTIFTTVSSDPLICSGKQHPNKADDFNICIFTATGTFPSVINQCLWAVWCGVMWFLPAARSRLWENQSVFSLAWSGVNTDCFEQGNTVDIKSLVWNSWYTGTPGILQVPVDFGKEPSGVC